MTSRLTERRAARTRRRCATAVGVGAVVLAVVSALSIAWNDNLGDPMTFQAATPTRTTAPRTASPIPVLAATVTVTETANITLSAPVRAQDTVTVTRTPPAATTTVTATLTVSEPATTVTATETTTATVTQPSVPPDGLDAP